MKKLKQSVNQPSQTGYTPLQIALKEFLSDTADAILSTLGQYVEIEWDQQVLKKTTVKQTERIGLPFAFGVATENNFGRN